MLAGLLSIHAISARTGSRTFDAASYLQSNGADAVLIEKSLKEDLDTYLLRSHLLQTMEFVNGNLAIVHGEMKKSYDTVVAAQTADTMLSMEAVDLICGYKTSGRQVGISARSLGQYNVQTIMEKLGGGGHLSMQPRRLRIRRSMKSLRIEEGSHRSKKIKEENNK